MERIELAEDIASETFALALDTWPYKGSPENPTAWLYAVAKNKAKNHITRLKIFEQRVRGQLMPTRFSENQIDLTLKGIADSQLQMLFAICHPSLSSEAQIGLALRILCGFGIEEIANAFFVHPETIKKRLARAKEKLREENVQIAFPQEQEIQNRLETVLQTIYLLFSEGYYSESKNAVLREDLCLEAMRLTQLLVENTSTNLPIVNALMSLMCFHASRFPARKNENGDMVLYQEQNEALWNRELISKGVYFLHAAAKGSILSKYHLEAHIAYWHTVKEDSRDKWENILQWYNRLLQIDYSPIAALNRTFALYKANLHLPNNEGQLRAIQEAEKLQLNYNHYYYTLLGKLYSGLNSAKAKENFVKALQLAKTDADKKTITRYLSEV